MIDIDEIYEEVAPVDVQTRLSDKFRRIPYSIGAPSAVGNLLDMPVDLTHRLKLVKKQEFNVSRLPDPEWRLKLSRGAVFSAKLGEGMEYGVKSDKICFFKDGMAFVDLAVDDAFIDGYIKLLDAQESADDYDAAIASVKRAAAAEYEKNNPFDGDDAFVVRRGVRDKMKLRNQQQAINKKRAFWEQNRAHAVAAAVKRYNDERDRRITGACGFTPDAVRIILNGSLTETGRLYWYPTVLDLCRMLDRIVIIPADLAVAVNDNDQIDPSGGAKFEGDVLFESWEEVVDGSSAFDDIRDSEHKSGSGVFIKFPAAKSTRWKEFCDKAGSRDIPLDQYHGITHPRQAVSVYKFMDGDKLKTTIGDLGPVYCKIEELESPFDTLKMIVMKNGVVMYYRKNNSRMITAMFVPPEQLIKIMKFAKKFAMTSQRSGIPVWLLLNCMKNVSTMPQTGDMYAFAQTPGTRRYIS